MKLPHTIGDLTIQTRCPGFLEALDDEDYCDVFRTMAKDMAFTVPTWDNLHREARDTQKVVTNILHHIMTWYQADWTFPECADE